LPWSQNTTTKRSIRFIHPVTLKPLPASQVTEPEAVKGKKTVSDTPPAGTVKSILPCTPLAIVKVLEHIGVYNKMLEYGDRARGKVITVINRYVLLLKPLLVTTTTTCWT
jgi:methylenetetrahydrofolate dehydrogenase (NAD+)